MKLKSDDAVWWSNQGDLSCALLTTQRLRMPTALQPRVIRYVAGSTEISSYTHEQSHQAGGSALWNIGEVHSLDPSVVEATGKDLPEEPEAAIWDLHVQTGFLKPAPYHYAKHTVGSVTENLFFRCLSSTVSKNAAQSFFFSGSPVTIISVYHHHQILHWTDSEMMGDRTFQIFFFQISQLVFQINLTVQPLITKEAVDFDGTRLQSLLATLVISSVLLLRGLPTL